LAIEIERLDFLFQSARDLHSELSSLAPPVGRGASLRNDVDRRCGGVMGDLELSAHLTVRPGCLEGFKRQAAELIRITKEQDTRTLRYDWFLSTDGTECEVREAYTGPEGLIEHNTHVLEARTKLFKDYADNHFMTVYGEPSQPLLDLLRAHAVGFKWFTFVQGLEPSPVSLSR
jgi:hypothetical protein